MVSDHLILNEDARELNSLNLTDFIVLSCIIFLEKVCPDLGQVCPDLGTLRTFNFSLSGGIYLIQNPCRRTLLALKYRGRPIPVRNGWSKRRRIDVDSNIDNTSIEVIDTI